MGSTWGHNGVNLHRPTVLTHTGATASTTQSRICDLCVRRVVRGASALFTEDTTLKALSMSARAQGPPENIREGWRRMKALRLYSWYQTERTPIKRARQGCMQPHKLGVRMRIV